MAETRLIRAEWIPYVIIDPPRSSQRFQFYAFQVLRVLFTAFPVMAGVDNFYSVLSNWDREIANPFAHAIPLGGHSMQLIMGGLEIAVGVLVAFVPRVGAFILAGGLSFMSVASLRLSGYSAAALFDFGLAVAAVALGVIAWDLKRRIRPRFPKAA